MAETKFRALHKMGLPIFTVAGDDAESPGEHRVTSKIKEPGDPISVKELADSRQTEDDISALLADGAMCSAEDYDALVAKAEEKVAEETKINTLRALNLNDDQIAAVLAIPTQAQSSTEEGGDKS